MSDYVLEFELPGLPKMANQLLRGHWIVKHRHAAKWKQAVGRATHGRLPKAPLASAALCLTRVSSHEPDFDGLVSGFKAIIDGLVEVGVLATDKPSCIGQPQFLWERGKRGAGKVRVKVQSVNQPQRSE